MLNNIEVGKKYIVSGIGVFGVALVRVVKLENDNYWHDKYKTPKNKIRVHMGHSAIDICRSQFIREATGEEIKRNRVDRNTLNRYTW